MATSRKPAPEDDRRGYQKPASERLREMGLNPDRILEQAAAAEAAYRAAPSLVGAVDADTLACLDSPGFRAALQRLAMRGPSPELDAVALGLRGRGDRATAARRRRGKGLSLAFDRLELPRFEAILRAAAEIVEDAPGDEIEMLVRKAAAVSAKESTEPERAFRVALGEFPMRLAPSVAKVLVLMRELRRSRGPLAFKRGAIRLAALAHGTATATPRKALRSLRRRKP